MARKVVRLKFEIKSSVTKGTCNRPLAELFVLATYECRKALSDVWMTRTHSARGLTFKALSLRSATLSEGLPVAESY